MTETHERSPPPHADLRDRSRLYETLNRISQSIVSDLDLERVVQAVTDAATEFSGAQFGAFFYNVLEDGGESYLLYTLSGAPREAFERFGLPRNTAVFAPTFRGERIVRSADIRTDARYGKSALHHGMPKGHLPVVSYLAVPVISRSGEVLGGLFFGHPKPGVFTAETESLVAGIAAYAGIAIDNARLHQAAQREIEQRKRAEEAQDLMLREVKHRFKNALATIQVIAARTYARAEKEDHQNFQARLRALAGAIDLLTTRDWASAPVRDVIDRTLSAFQHDGDERFDIQGPEAALDVDSSLATALALHELATNAMKYGALSNEEGRVTIAWTIDATGERPSLRLTWRESGGPPVAAPEKTGFGTVLIERALGGAQHSAAIDFAPEGVFCSFRIPI